eukprot:8865462-Lingulodinium_polyedra.AAC.1
MCPHCGQAEETAEHRFWACPRWGRLRAQAIGGADPRGVAGPASGRHGRLGPVAGGPGVGGHGG